MEHVVINSILFTLLIARMQLKIDEPLFVVLLTPRLIRYLLKPVETIKIDKTTTIDR